MSGTRESKLGKKNPMYGKFGEKSSNWKGGRQIRGGYIFVCVPGGWYRQEHRIVWEKHKGKIPKNYIIHHINGEKQDNRIGNLQMMSRAEHNKLHDNFKRK